jgi:hypothetical protein
MSSKKNTSLQIDHKQYDIQTLHVCEVIACFILNKLYNEIYLNVKELKTNDKIPNLTDGYKQGLMFFFKGLKKPENMKKILLGIHDMFIENPGFAGMTFRDCIHKISDQFTPHNDREGFNEKQKQKIVMKVMLDVCSNYIDHLISNRLGMVIDNRKQKQNIDILKNELINMLLFQRERMLSDYYSVVVGANKTNMPKGFETKLKAMVSDAIRDKIIAQKQAKKYYQLALKFKHELDQMKNTNNKSYHSQPVPPPEIISGSESDEGEQEDQEEHEESEEDIDVPQIDVLAPMASNKPALTPARVQFSKPRVSADNQSPEELNLDDLVIEDADESDEIVQPIQPVKNIRKPETSVKTALTISSTPTSNVQKESRIVKTMKETKPETQESQEPQGSKKPDPESEQEESSGDNLDDLLDDSDSGRYGEEPPKAETPKVDPPKPVKKPTIDKTPKNPRPAINVAPQSLTRVSKKPETNNDDLFN